MPFDNQVRFGWLPGKISRQVYISQPVDVLSPADDKESESWIMLETLGS